jgi:alkanesulfonate monooxygenase SsuD/methylene tetrahydromethanopterin reductase-like flavin-dependent oxidoreductase (luciferase family)
VSDRALSQVGVLYSATDKSMNVVDLAQAMVARGLGCLIVPERTHMPATPCDRFPSGAEIPHVYRPILEPYVALAFVVANTSLSIATGVSLVAQHDPIALAKHIATLVHLSYGRFTLGVGYGWHRGELANHGYSSDERRDVVREYGALMRALWSDTVAQYESRRLEADIELCLPEAAGRDGTGVTRLRISDRNFGEIVSWADGWFPPATISTRWRRRSPPSESVGARRAPRHDRSSGSAKSSPIAAGSRAVAPPAESAVVTAGGTRRRPGRV